MARLRKHDIGTEICIDLEEDVTTAMERRILYRKPDGTTGEWEAQQDPNDTDIVYHVIEDGDIDMSGEWRLQAHLEFANGAWYSNYVWLVAEPIILRV